MDDAKSELVTYLNKVLEERHLSIRALATYSGLSHATIRRMLQGLPVEYESLQKLADYLNVPHDAIYRMAGILPEDQERSRAAQLIEHLFAKLPEADQQEVIDIIKLKIERQGKH